MRCLPDRSEFEHLNDNHLCQPDYSSYSESFFFPYIHIDGLIYLTNEHRMIGLSQDMSDCFMAQLAIDSLVGWLLLPFHPPTRRCGKENDR